MRLLQGLGYLSEDRKGEGLALSLSIADNLTMTRFSSCADFGWLNLSKQSEQAKSLINEVGIKISNANQAVSTLSGGNQQKVAIGRIVHQEADILLLDEPTRGIDIGSKVQVYETIANLAEEGKALRQLKSLGGWPPTACRPPTTNHQPRGTNPCQKITTTSLAAAR